MRIRSNLSVWALVGCVCLSEIQARTIYYNNFDESAGNEWSHQTREVTPIGARQFLGRFGNESVSLHLDNLPPHQIIRVTFDLFIIGSWEGSDLTRPGQGPDVWTLTADGEPPLLRTSFDNYYAPLFARPERQSFPEGYGQGYHPAQSGAEEKNTLGYRNPSHSELPQDAVYHLSFEFPHEVNELHLSFSANCMPIHSDLQDESWGLDNVIVEFPEEDGQVLLVTDAQPGGNVTVPGQGQFWYSSKSNLQIEAEANSNHVFDRWSGTAVERGFVTDPFSARTSVRIEAACSLIAHYISDPDSSILVVDDKAAMDPGPGDPLVSDPEEDGTLKHPFDSIQKAVDTLNPQNHRGILVLSGLYKGPGNRDIDLKGKRMRLYSSGGAEYCIIDCAGQGRGFFVHRGESRATRVEGFTIRSGIAQEGGGIYCHGSPTFSNCNLSSNKATEHGSAVYCASGSPKLRDCSIQKGMENSLVVAAGATLELGGLVQLETAILSGTGRIAVPLDTVLELRDCTQSCDLTGSGWINVFDRFKLTHDAKLDLTDLNANSLGIGGTLTCQGLLELQEQANIFHANIETTHCLLEGTSLVAQSAVRLLNPMVYGQFMIRDQASLQGNTISAQSDNFLTFDSQYNGLLDDNTVDLMLSGEQVLEVRGTGRSCNSGCVQTANVSSVFDRSQWQLRTLNIVEGARVTLTDRFDDQRDGGNESLYAQTLTLGPDAELNCSGLCIQAGVYESDPTSRTIQGPLYGQSLGELEFSDTTEFTTRVQVSSRLDVQLIDDTMYLILGKTEFTRARAHFDRCVEDRLLIRFKYLFVSPDIELRIYLSNSPFLGERDPLHTRLVGNLFPPPAGRPGSEGSSRYGQFELWVDTTGLNLSNGTWVELETIRRPELRRTTPLTRWFNAPESQADSASIDDLAVEICSGICMDLDASTTVDAMDVEIILCLAGKSVTGYSNAARCLEGTFSMDGTLDSTDLYSWEWMLLNCNECGNLCLDRALPLTGPVGNHVTLNAMSRIKTRQVLMGMGTSIKPPQGLTILDKLYSDNMGLVEFADRRHVFGTNEDWNTYWLESTVSRGTIRFVRSHTGELYMVNSEQGITNRLGKSIVTPGRQEVGKEPRYSQNARVTIGLQGSGERTSGRPILDAVVVDENTIFVVPVVVQPLGQGSSPYLAAAKLSGSNRRIAHIFDDPNRDITHSPTLDNPNLAGLREIELDSEGNVYILNVNALNSSTILWKYSATGQVLNRMELEGLGIFDPVGLCVTHDSDGLVYLACGRNDPNDRDGTYVFGLSPNTLEVERRVTIKGLHHITGMTEQAGNGTLWIVGYSLDAIPEHLNRFDLPRYGAYIAKLETNYVGDSVQAEAITDAGENVVLPISVTYIEP